MNHLIALAVGFVLDMIIGDPAWLCKYISHPIIWIGKLIARLERWLRRRMGHGKVKVKERTGGTLLVIGVVCIVGMVTYGGLLLCYSIHWSLGLLVEAFLCYQILACKSLKTESMKVLQALEDGSLADGQLAVSYIVGRDTGELDEEGVIKATVETVAENTTDGVIAPMVYMAFFGALGGMIYKSINTMDSMVGYKNETYRYFGTVAAKLDDVVNYIPARLTAIFMIGAAAICGYDWRCGFYIWRRDRRNHKSPNSAQTESVCAGALGIQLAGDAYYFGELYKKPTIGDKKREIECSDIKRANQLLYAVAWIGFALVIGGNLWMMTI